MIKKQEEKSDDEKAYERAFERITSERAFQDGRLIGENELLKQILSQLLKIELNPKLKLTF